MLYTSLSLSLYVFLCKRGTSRDTGGVKGEAGGEGGGGAVERGGLGRKVVLKL